MPSRIRRASWAWIVLVLATARGGGAAPREAPRRLSAETEQRYAAAVEALRRGDAEPVLREFARADAAQSLVGDYTRYLHAEALLGRGDLAGARSVAESLAEEFPRRRIGRSALLLAAYAAARAGDEGRNEALLRRFLAGHGDAPEMPIALYLLGASFEARGQRENAALTYRELTLLAPASDYADGAGDRLRELGRAGFTLAPLSLEDRLTRAERLLVGGMPEAARDEAAAVAPDATDRNVAVRALGVVASALERMRRYEAAAGVIEQALARAPDDGKAALRLELGRMQYRAGKRESALVALAGIDESREAEAAEAAYLRGRLFEDGGLFGDAALAYERTVTRYPAREVVAPALWRLGWLAYLQGDRAKAAEHWMRLSDLAAGRRFRIPATYWAGRAREELGSAAEATRFYERVLTEAPRGYYGVLAAARTKDLPPLSGDPPVALPADPAQALADDADFARIETLRRLGLFEHAVGEMEDLTSRSVADPVKLFWLSVAYQRYERYELSLRILRRYFGEVTVSAHPAIPRSFWEMAYPFAWPRELTDAAARSGLDPFFVAAVAREESSFYPLARSRAGARGLMQLLPETARTIVARRGLAFKDGELLDEPATNLLLAAYNAGPARVREWWSARRTSDMEAFVEQIPYEETRLYVKRVMGSWEEYRRLYGLGPAP
ncbi:MAG: hypothetical protein DMD82_08645 [Candidatus Rokuibacteriota bacterium]|nr:MAG: hypothetical protein DMD82_08645 [Candidatus Rokubacteria bacterium]